MPTDDTPAGATASAPGAPAPSPSVEDFLVATPPEHDVNGVATVAGELLLTKVGTIPTIPRAPGGATITQLQFKAYCLALLNGQKQHQAARRAGIPPKLTNTYMQKGARSAEAGIVDAYQVFYVLTNIYQALYQEWLMEHINRLVRESKDAKAVMYLLKQTGFEREDQAAEEVEDQAAVADALFRTLPKVQQ